MMTRFLQPLFVLFFLLFVVNAGQAQFFTVGASTGFVSYRGDLAQSIAPSNFKQGFGLNAQYHKTKLLSFGIGAYYLPITGTDLDDYNPFYQRRNLSFSNDLIEVSVQGHLSLLPFNPGKNCLSTPYLSFGLGGVYSNPKAQLDGVWYDLRKFGTEGQFLNGGTKTYSKVHATIPIGFGMRMTTSRRSWVQIDLTNRLSLTDYLDDVSKNYPDIRQLSETNPLAAQLAYRGSWGANITDIAKKRRGDPSKIDQYLFLSVEFHMALDAKPKFKRKANIVTERR
jgi:Domain of unknown function (DUF6089)